MSTPPPLPGERPFATGPALVLGIGCALSLVFGFLLLVWRSERLDETTAGSDSYSRSALGHHLLHELLQETGRPVARSRHLRMASRQRSLLIVAEPRREDLDRFRAVVEGAEHVLCVLPKRAGHADDRNRAWIDDQHLLRDEVPGRFLEVLAPNATVVRPEPGTPRWRSLGRMPDLPEPVLAEPQLIAGTGFKPLVRCAAGTLLAEIQRDETTVFLLADPDLIANHGLTDGDNAAWALAALDELRQQRGLVIDETLHGFELEPSVWEQLGRFPLVLVLASLFGVFGIVGWAAIGRFGPVLPPPPALAAEKRFLLDNTASLLVRGGHTSLGVRRYFRDRLRALARTQPVRDRSDAAALTAARAAAARAGRTATFEALVARVDELTEDRQIDPRRAIVLARRIHEECQEIAHGTR